MRKSQVEGSAWLFVLGEIWYDMGRVGGDVFLGDTILGDGIWERVGKG